MRNPGRTSTTAAAHMVGLGLVVFVAVFANGIKASFDDAVGRLVKADLIVRSETMQPIPAGASSAVARSSNVAATSGVLIDQVKVNGKGSNVLTDTMNGVAPANLARLYGVDWVQGDDTVLNRLRGDTALVEERFSKTHDVSVGDSYRIETPSGGTAALRVIGVYRDPQLLQGTIVPQDLFDRVSAARDPWMIFADARQGIPAEVARRHIEAALEGFPTAAVESEADYSAAIGDQFDQFVYLLYALLAMSVVISLFGIANSLFLSIHERTREFGLLRAVGATRAQVRRMVRYESIITAVIGGLLGTAVGLLFAFLVTQSLGDLGLGFAPPLGQLVIFLLLAVAVGVIAAVMPALRGARLQVLRPCAPSRRDSELARRTGRSTARQPSRQAARSAGSPPSPASQDPRR
jgi:putative ABC transport system permease protein